MIFQEWNNEIVVKQFQGMLHSAKEPEREESNESNLASFTLKLARRFYVALKKVK